MRETSFSSLSGFSLWNVKMRCLIRGYGTYYESGNNWHKDFLETSWRLPGDFLEDFAIFTSFA